MTDAPSPEETEVARLLAKAERAAEFCDAPDAARSYLAIATLVSRNAGLDKRHATKIDAHLTGPRNTDDWLANKLAEGNDDG